MIVVTGGIACGKSTLVETAREMGYDVVDADEWYHRIFVGSTAQTNLERTLFGSISYKTAAFQHLNWTVYEKGVADAFCEYIRNRKPQVCVIPEYFKREDYFSARLGAPKVLTIERENNVDAAKARDTHRSNTLTEKIAASQTPKHVRVELSDFILYNEGSKDQFKQECQKWLESHLPAASTRPTKGIAT